MQQEAVVDISISAVLLLAWYYSLRRSTDGSERRLSWILTLFSALVCFFGCLPLVTRAAKEGWPVELIYGDDRVSRGLVRFFLTYLVCDSALIVRDYPTIGGWMHHVPYFLFMSTALYFRCPAMFAVFMPMELSTIFLASGFIWPQVRADLSFGVTFFLGRIVYHLWLWRRLYDTRSSSPFFVWPFSLLPFFMHAFWFVKWCWSMLKKRRASGGSGSSQAGSGEGRTPGPLADADSRQQGGDLCGATRVPAFRSKQKCA